MEPAGQRGLWGTSGYDAVNQAVARGREHSPFLRFHLGAGTPVAASLADGRLDLALSLAACSGEGLPAMAALRQERSAWALALAIGDLAGLLPLEQVVRALSDLADRQVDLAVRTAILERCPDGEPAGFAVLALGKLGGRELNYSSDIDLIFLFDPTRLPRRGREEPGQAAVRVGQRVVELLQKRTEDGYAFRLDLRLRPSAEVTPIALPYEAAIGHYESSALAWERAAFIRARPCGGDVGVAQAFLEAIHPFVWRRSLDFGAIGEVLAMSGQIRDHFSAGQTFGPGFDLKRGRGGIREIEFFAQAHQLIHGGRDSSLRCASTLDALAALTVAGRISGEDQAVMTAAYRALRTAEHRLQMVDDRQTHMIPTEPAALDGVARLDGSTHGDAWLSALRPHVEAVSARYDALAPEEVLTLGNEPTAQLAALEIRDADTAAARIASWRSGKARALRTPAAQAAFEAVLPQLVEAFAAAPDPLFAMNRFDQLVERLPSGVNFFRLLEARPALTAHLATILAHAPALAEQLGRRPELLDGLIDATAFALPPSVDDLVTEFSRSDRVGEDYQQLLDRVRRRVNERRFALGVQLVALESDPVSVARGYSRVAEAAVRVLAGAAEESFAAQHGRVPGTELVILGLGRLGGEALTHASDLDLIYLFAGSHEASSDGARPLRANDYYNRLAPRITAALSVSTASGPLYEVDTRLRPSGRDGMLAVSLDAFSAYHREHSWTWEQMALTRARALYGSDAAKADAEKAVATVLRQPRDGHALIHDAIRMREEIARHKPPASPLDVKLGDGGLVDLEFTVQVLLLRHRTGFSPRLADAITNLAAVGLADPHLRDALRLLTSMLVTLRLVSPARSEPPPASRALVAQACGFADWDSLLEAHRAARQKISEAWRGLAAEARESR